MAEETGGVGVVEEKGVEKTKKKKKRVNNPPPVEAGACGNSYSTSPC